MAKKNKKSIPALQTIDAVSLDTVTGGRWIPRKGTDPAIFQGIKGVVDAMTQTKKENQICTYGYDLGPKQLEGIKSGALTGSLGQQPFIQGFWPVLQLYLQIDRGVSAANVDTRAQLVTKDNVGSVGKRFEN